MKKAGKWLYYIVLLPFIAAIGFVAGYASNSYMLAETTPFGKVVFLLAALLIMLLAALIQTIAHEFGHLLFGKLTGYRFCSFRIGSVVLARAGDRWMLRRYRIPGTAGQCLMCIPEGETYPYVWYNLGGILINVFISLLSLIPVLLFHQAVQIVFPCAMLSIIGFIFAVTNGVPFGVITNDGCNLRSMKKSAVERHAFRTQLLINEQMTAGVDLADMPEEWFTFPENTDWTAPITSCSASLLVERLICQGNLEAAKARCMEWLEIAKDMPPVAELSIRIDAILCELALNGSSTLVREMRTKALDAYVKSAKTPAAFLLLQAFEIMGGGDDNKIRQFSTAFDKACKSYVYPGEAAMLRTLQKRIGEQLAK